ACWRGAAGHGREEAGVGVLHDARVVVVQGQALAAGRDRDLVTGGEPGRYRFGEVGQDVGVLADDVAGRAGRGARLDPDLVPHAGEDLQGPLPGRAAAP